MEGLSELTLSRNKPVPVNESCLLEEDKHFTKDEAKVYTKIGYQDCKSDSIIHDASETSVKLIKKNHNSKKKLSQEDISLYSSDPSFNQKISTTFNTTGTCMAGPSNINVSFSYKIL